MKNNILFLLTVCLALSINAQISYDELSFETKTSLSAYKPKGRHYAFIRSKKGTEGVNKSEKADSVAQLVVTDIVLVFTEMDEASKAGRDEANQERWLNLIQTYPEYFDYSPALVNYCQCNSSGDAEAFKKVQGFYVYFEGDESEVAEAPPVQAPKAPAAIKEEKAPEKPKETVKSPEPEKEVAKHEEPKRDEPREEAPKKETKKEAPAKKEAMDDAWPDAAASKPAAPKKTGFSKPRKATDPKACRPPCYENGDEDLNAFFRENITLSKKQKKKNKNLIAMVRLQLNFDGSIKTSQVTGANTELNQQVEEAIKRMNLWNAAVKNGVTIKSDVRMTLRYDKETKSMKTAEMIINPKPTPKCKCVSDAEMFGS